MSDNLAVDLLLTLIARGSCRSTINGWIWYCDQHDTHGNADSEEEAYAVAKAHVMYQCGDHVEDGDLCDIYIVRAGKGEEV